MFSGMCIFEYVKMKKSEVILKFTILLGLTYSALQPFLD